MSYFNHSIDLSKTNIDKLKKGLPSTIKHQTIGSGVELHLGPINHKKVMKAFEKGKNIRLTLTADEITQNSEKNGEGFGKFLHNKLNVNVKKLRKYSKEAGAAAVGALIAAGGTALGAATGNPITGAVAGTAAGAAARMAIQGSGVQSAIREVKKNIRKANNTVDKVQNVFQGSGVVNDKVEKVKQLVRNANNVVDKSQSKVMKVVDDDRLKNIMSKYVSRPTSQRAVESEINGEGIRRSIIKRRGLGNRISHVPMLGGSISEYSPNMNGYSSQLPLNSPAMNPFIPTVNPYQPSILDIMKKKGHGSVGFNVGSGFQTSGSGFQTSGSGFQTSGSGFKNSGY
jgi:hypothetical protein